MNAIGQREQVVRSQAIPVQSSAPASWAYDPLGQVTSAGATDTTANRSYPYDSIGNAPGNSDNYADFRYRFSTKPLDSETGLYYYGYRFYDPLTGRWPSRDPIGEQGGVNLYGFVGNDGVNWADILGLTEGGDKPWKVPALEKCAILIVADHLFGKQFKSGGGTFNDFRQRDFKNAPQCSRIGYVTCGGSWLNKKIPKEHSSGMATDFPMSPFDEEARNRAIDAGVPKDQVDQLGYLEDIIAGIDSAVAAAQSKASELCKAGGGCDYVKLRVACSEEVDELNGRVKKDEANFFRDGGKRGDFDYTQAEKRARENARCGKTTVYDCALGNWGDWVSSDR